MKLSLICIVHLACVSAGLFSHDGPLAHRSSSSVSNRSVPAPQGAVSLNHRRQRPLFARRGQYERQRILVQRHRVAAAPPKHLPHPSKEAPKPQKPNCSQLTQSCLPQSGCCDPCASCHCRFFNTICFCRRTNSSSFRLST